MKSRPHPSQERLRELFEYREDNISQPLVWKIKPSNNVKIGDFAGGFNKGDGYYQIGLIQLDYKLHRLVWIYHNGDIPDGMQIDHIDGNPLNNLTENLRLATHGENQHNSKIRSDNTSGVKGVHWNKGNKKWKSQIYVEGKLIYLGYFDTIVEAEAAVIAARKKHHGDFSRQE